MLIDPPQLLFLYIFSSFLFLFWRENALIFLFLFSAFFSWQQKPVGGVAVLPVKEKESKQKDEAVNGEKRLIAAGVDKLIFNLIIQGKGEKDPNESLNKSQSEEKPTGDGDDSGKFFKRVSVFFMISAWY